MRWLAALGLAVSVGCSGGDRVPMMDSGVPPDSGTPTFVTPPMAPMVVCPEGWTESPLAVGGSFCEPWSEEEDTTCAPGQAWFPGASACETVGPPCPAGDLPEDLPPGADVIFVSTSAPPVGRDGTRDRPFTNLDEAFRAAAGGEIFALGKGRHRIGGTFPDDTSFWGACAAETELVADFVDESTGTVTAHEDAHVAVRNVTVVGDQPGFRVEERATLELHDVIVSGSGLAGAFVLDGTLIAENFVVRDSSPRDGMFGRALQVQEGGRAEVTRAVFERVHDIAVQVTDPGSSATIRDVAIRDVTADGTADLGRAIEVSFGGALELERAVVEDVRDAGIFVGGGEATVRDTLFRGIRETAAGAFGRGMHLEAGGRLVAERVTVDDCRELGVYGSTVGSTMELRDLVVRRTRPRSADELGGRGVQLQWGVSATIERALIDDNVGFGLFVASDGTDVTVTDVRITNTRQNVADSAGRGAEVLLGAHLALERVHIENSIEIGYFVSGSTTTVRDLVIARTQPQEDTGWYGRGIVVTGADAVMTGSRVHVFDNTELGIYVDEGVLTLDEVRVERTARQPCTRDCMGKTAGIGLFVIDGGTATLTNFLLADNALAGLTLFEGSRAPLSNGAIVGHPVGIYSSDDTGVALSDLSDVELVDNERNIDAMLLPVPDTSIPGQVEL